jgi:glutamyl-tRNA synthetase/nondiscriminating glutamyl-tRNA synthetase
MEMARRFALESVGHSAAVFDREKLAWVNRHYLRLATPGRLTSLAMPSFLAAGFVSSDSAEARAFVESVVPLASGSIDRVDQMPERLRFLFVFDPAESIARADVREVLREPGAREVIDCLARELAGVGRLDRESFRAAAGRVKQATGRKARHLFHPIRVALTGEAGGPELDLALPAIDRGAELPASCGVAPILFCRERAALFATEIGRRGLP